MAMTDSFAGGRGHLPINEAKRVRLGPELEASADALAGRLWAMRRGRIDRPVEVDTWTFRTHDGAQAMMSIVVDPALEDYWAITDTNPPYSRDPMDLEMRVCHPRHFSTRSDLVNIIVHETVHAIDPSLTTGLSVRDQVSYGWWRGPEHEAGYLADKGEYTAVHSEFLDALVRQFRSMRNTHSRAVLLATLGEVVAHFARPGRPTDRAGRLLARLATDRDLPGLVADIKSHSPAAHRSFLGKLYATADEIRAEVINQGRDRS